MRKSKILFSVVFLLGLMPVEARSMSDFGPAKHSGKRTDPIPALDGYADIRLEDLYGADAIVRIGISGILRGDDILQVPYPIIFADRPEPKNEYALIYVYVSNVKDLTGKDKPITINSRSFAIIDTKYSQKSNYIFAHSKELLNTAIYEGGEAEGWIPCEAPTGEPFYVKLGDRWFVLNAKSDPYEQL